MKDDTHSIISLLDKMQLVQRVNELEPSKLLSELPKSNEFKLFTKDLEGWIKEIETENEWHDNKDISNLIQELQNAITSQLNTKENDMFSKIALLFALIGTKIKDIYKKKYSKYIPINTIYY